MITSVTNEKIKYIKKLKEHKNIVKENKFIIEGFHLVEEAYKKGVLDSVYILENNEYDFEVEKYFVTNNVMKSVSSLKSIPTIIGIVNISVEKEIIGNKIIICDGIQDPGNLGTIIRSAVAFNVDTIILSEDTVNIYNDKVLRSTQGMIFNLNIIKMNITDAIKKIKKKNIPVIGTNMDGKLLNNQTKISSYALILGNEGLGVKNEILNLCDEIISIEMNNLCESLNVAVAGSIIMYYLR